MAKKRDSKEVSPPQLSRRQLKLDQEEAEARKRVYTAVGGVLGLVLLVLIIGFVVVYVVQPSQPVAIVEGEDVSAGEWQDEVRMQRAQLINNIDQFYENTDGNVGLVQQLLGQQMSLLLPQSEASLGEVVLENLIEDKLIRAEAARRGITVSAAEVDARIGESYNFFGGGLPTPFPTATASPQPTPSVTPIPTAVITEVVPTNTPFPTLEPQPTPTAGPTSTPVSQDSFDEQLGEQLASLQALGVSEEQFRRSVESSIYREKLADALAEEQGLETAVPHISFYVMSFGEEGDASAALAQVAADGYLATWNTIRSAPADPNAPLQSAQEVLWQPVDQIETQFEVGIANIIADLEVGEPSGILTRTVDMATGDIDYYVVMPTGREVRELSQGAIDSRKQEILAAFVSEKRAEDVEVFDRWRNIVPSVPALDPKYLVQPTPEAPAALPPLDAGGGSEIIVPPVESEE
jgi:hypothetical protein